MAGATRWARAARAAAPRLLRPPLSSRGCSSFPTAPRHPPAFSASPPAFPPASAELSPPPPFPPLEPPPPPPPRRRRLLERTSAITRALAPPDRPLVELSEEHEAELDGLYAALTQPLEWRLPSQAERRERMAAVDTRPEVFFERRERRADSYAFLVRCLGVQGQLRAAHEAVEEMRRLRVAPDANVYCALVDACGRAGDVQAAEAAAEAMRAEGLRLVAPVFAGLAKAYRVAGRDVEAWAPELLRRMRERRVPEDAPTHTAIICAAVEAGKTEVAWRYFEGMREAKVRADAVAFTAMIMACVRDDRLEMADNLMEQMNSLRVEPTLATRNAYINACAARCHSLSHLHKFDKERKRYLVRHAIDVEVSTPLRLAFAQLGRLEDEGIAPCQHTYLALMRACAGAADVERAQNLMSRMLDVDVTPHKRHFHMLLKACVRGQIFKPTWERKNHVQVALAVPPSMVAIGLEVEPTTIDLVLETHTAGLHAYAALDVLEELYAHHGLAPTRRAFELMLRLAFTLKRPRLARELMEAMAHHGHPPSDEQQAAAHSLEHPRPYSAHPPLKQAAWSASKGHHVPQPSAATAAIWRRRRKPYVETGRPDRPAGGKFIYISPHFVGLEEGEPAAIAE